MSRFVSNKTEQELNAPVGVAKQIKAGTTCLGSIEKVEFKEVGQNNTPLIELYFQAAEESEGLKNEKQPCGNPSYQYCKNTFWLTDKTLALDGNYNIVNWLATLAGTLGEREAWDEVVGEATNNEELAEAIETFFIGKEFVGAIQGEWKTINLGEKDIDFCEPFLSHSYFAANKDVQESVDKLNEFVTRRMEEGKWLKDSRVAVETPVETTTETVETGW